MIRCVDSQFEFEQTYAFELLSRYFDVIHWPFCAAPLKVERTYWHDWEQTWEVTGLGCGQVKNKKSPKNHHFYFNIAKIAHCRKKNNKSRSNNEKVAKFGDKIPKLATLQVGWIVWQNLILPSAICSWVNIFVDPGATLLLTNQIWRTSLYFCEV